GRVGLSVWKKKMCRAPRARRERNGESLMTRILMVSLTSVACLIASTSLPAAQSTTTGSASTSAEQSAREELVRRQAPQLSAQKALEYDPKNHVAEAVLIRVKQSEAGVATTFAGVPGGPRPDQTPAFVAKKDQIKMLFREGRILMNSGQYDEAEKRFQQILLF